MLLKRDSCLLTSGLDEPMTLLNPRRLVVYNTNLSILNIFTGNKTKKLFISKENYSLEKKKKKPG